LTAIVILWQENQNAATGACVPPLGLSNKAVYTIIEEAGENAATKETSRPHDQHSESYFTPQCLTGFTAIRNHTIIISSLEGLIRSPVSSTVAFVLLFKTKIHP